MLMEFLVGSRVVKQTATQRNVQRGELVQEPELVSRPHTQGKAQLTMTVRRLATRARTGFRLGRNRR